MYFRNGNSITSQVPGALNHKYQESLIIAIHPSHLESMHQPAHIHTHTHTCTHSTHTCMHTHTHTHRVVQFLLNLLHVHTTRPSKLACRSLNRHTSSGRFWSYYRTAGRVMIALVAIVSLLVACYNRDAAVGTPSPPHTCWITVLSGTSRRPSSSSRPAIFPAVYHVGDEYTESKLIQPNGWSLGWSRLDCIIMEAQSQKVSQQGCKHV